MLETYNHQHAAMEKNEAPQYYVWGIDRVAYGPVELPTLVSWIRDERVEKSTWIFDQRGDRWTPAQEITELKGVFGKYQKQAATPASEAESKIKPGSLRRIKILAEFADDQLMSFARYMEVRSVAQYAVIVNEGEQEVGS